LVQNNVELTGPTSWLERAPYRAHAEKLPISLQDHGNPVRYRNIWLRELGKPGRKEFNLPEAVLERYVGTYEVNPDLRLEVTRDQGRLLGRFSGVPFALFAESATKFFAKTTDVQVEFQFTDTEKVAVVSVGEGGMRAKKVP
jgi:hypothetical protein